MDRTSLIDYFTSEIRAVFPRRMALNTSEVAVVLTMCGRECAQEQARRLLDAGAFGKGLKPTSGGWLVPIPTLAIGLAEMMTEASMTHAKPVVQVQPSLQRLKRGRPTRTLAFALAGGEGVSEPPSDRHLFVLKPRPPQSDEKPSKNVMAFVERVVADVIALQSQEEKSGLEQALPNTEMTRIKRPV